MEQQQRRALAFVDVVDAVAVEFDEAALERKQEPVEPRGSRELNGCMCEMLAPGAEIWHRGDCAIAMTETM
jgi:hypothetical protein